MVTLRWRRSKTKDHRHLGNAPPETDTTTHAAAHTITYIATHTTRRPSRPFPLPYDIVEMIVAYLTHDFLTLEACSLISRSWYTAAVTHLHHTLTLTGDAPETHSQLKPLFTLRELGLAPLVKTIRVRQQSYGPTWFTPRGFDSHAFSGFTNVQTLRLGELDIYLFIPGNERSFEHFFPTLRSIALHNPCCTPRQLSHFLSPFSNLDDIEIQKYTCVYNSTTPDTVPVPFSAPKLRGRLLLHDFPRVETWTDLIVSWDGLRFRYMDLCRSTSCAPVLLDACANTLDTLRFSATDGSVDAYSVSFPELNLSRLKALRSLEVKNLLAGYLPVEHRRAIVMEVFSTVTSPVFSELVIVLEDDAMTYLSEQVVVFETLRMMNEVRPFKLTFLLEVRDFNQVGVEWGLVEALNLVAPKGPLDFLDSPPAICLGTTLV